MTRGIHKKRQDVASDLLFNCDPSRPKIPTAFDVSNAKQAEAGAVSGTTIEKVVLAACSDKHATLRVHKEQDILEKQTEEQRVQQWKRNLKNHSRYS